MKEHAISRMGILGLMLLTIVAVSSLINEIVLIPRYGTETGWIITFILLLLMSCWAVVIDSILALIFEALNIKYWEDVEQEKRNNQKL